MAASNDRELLAEGLKALKAGDKITAQTALREAIKLNPRLTEAWLGLAQTTDDPDRQRVCYENVLKIDPNHSGARAALATLGVSAPEPAAQSQAEDEADVDVPVESLRPRVQPVTSSVGVKPPQSIAGAPATFSMDDLLDTMKNLMASLQGTAGRGGNSEALSASWWHITVLVVLLGAVTGLLQGILNAILGLGFGSVLAIFTLPLLTPLKMGAALVGSAVLSRWFLAWRGKVGGTLVDHTMALARPWFAGSVALLVLWLILSLAGGFGATTLESFLIQFSLTLSGITAVIFILNVIIAIGVVYLVERGWAKVHPDSLGSSRAIGAVLALLIITMGT